MIGYWNSINEAATYVGESVNGQNIGVWIVNEVLHLIYYDLATSQYIYWNAANETAQLIHTDGHRVSTHRQIFDAERGIAFAIYEPRPEAGSSYASCPYFWRSDSGASGVPISNAQAECRSMEIELDHAGNPHIFYAVDTAANAEDEGLYYWSESAGLIQIAEGRVRDSRQMAFDNDNVAHLLWHRFYSNEPLYYWNSATQTNEELSSVNRRSFIEPDESGNIHLLWDRYESDTSQIRQWFYRVNDQPSVLLDSGETDGAIGDANLFMDSSDTAWLYWQEGTQAVEWKSDTSQFNVYSEGELLRNSVPVAHAFNSNGEIVISGLAENPGDTPGSSQALWSPTTGLVRLSNQARAANHTALGQNTDLHQLPHFNTPSGIQYIVWSEHQGERSDGLSAGYDYFIASYVLPLHRSHLPIIAR